MAVNRTNLAGHDCSCRQMFDFADSSAVARAEFFHHLELLWSQVELILDANFQLLLFASFVFVDF